MKIHIITIGKPKLAYAQTGWAEYAKRLDHFHQVRVTHVSDKQNNASHILATAGSAYKVSMVIKGQQFSSSQLASFLDKRALDGRETCFIIGGPEGLPAAVVEAADYHWSLSLLTLPHDLAMVVLLESLYRASTISAGLPYHK